MDIAGVLRSSPSPVPAGLSGRVDHLALINDQLLAASAVKQGQQYRGVVVNVNERGALIDIGWAVGRLPGRGGATPDLWSQVSVRVARVRDDGKLELSVM